MKVRFCLTLILTLYPRKRSVRDSHKIDALTGVGLKGFDVLPHAVGALFFHAGSGVRIGAEREGRGGMAEVFLHGLDVVPSTEAVHGKGVPEGMEAQIIKAVFLHQPLEAVVKGLVADIAPQLIGEHQLIRIRPGTPGGLRPCLLPLLLFTQSVHDLIGHGQSADLIILQTGEHILLGLAQLSVLFVDQKRNSARIMMLKSARTTSNVFSIKLPQ